MSLYLPEQKLGSHSEEGGSSNKFILKGRQTGTMHRGHTWVFRAESHDTMMAWYEDIKALTEKTAEERSQFVRTHSRRSLSRSSRRSASSDGLGDDEDEEPFSGGEVNVDPDSRPDAATRPQPGGRFPSDIQVTTQRGLQAPQSPSSLSSGNKEQSSDPQMTAAAGAMAATEAAHGQGARSGGEEQGQGGYGATGQTSMEEMSSQAAIANRQAHYDGVNPYTSEPVGGPVSEPVLQLEQQQQREAVNGEWETDVNDAVNEAGAAAGLQAVPESEAAAHETPAEAALGEGRGTRPTDNRTDSTATISNLMIPGGFPKGNKTSQ